MTMACLLDGDINMKHQTQLSIVQYMFLFLFWTNHKFLLLKIYTSTCTIYCDV